MSSLKSHRNTSCYFLADVKKTRRVSLGEMKKKEREGGRLNSRIVAWRRGGKKEGRRWSEKLTARESFDTLCRGSDGSISLQTTVLLPEIFIRKSTNNFGVVRGGSGGRYDDEVQLQCPDIIIQLSLFPPFFFLSFFLFSLPPFPPLFKGWKEFPLSSRVFPRSRNWWAAGSIVSPIGSFLIAPILDFLNHFCDGYMCFNWAILFPSLSDRDYFSFSSSSFYFPPSPDSIVMLRGRDIKKK